ncbi:ribosome biogenesis protein YTM1 [Sporothrix schenckii 1099-18]|uniref:Ribosome biogenesis protein YTM1 n=1 Tax=Sporothrix schenckii 1099-18 TaxID=1397361 RepID=A0A0F2LTE5_SPOSC|nr:ribosome biogenesis protein YTM1 [Sporothrix schenckii 1099-18]KJR80752.1 ribosome biogenesis protein YTM1 [Sporothrix schenckii 1099-18]
MAAAFDRADEDASAQVKVFFTTTEQDADLQLPESKRPLIVPADIRRYGLSRILNSESMLATDRPVPFDFLVDGAYLRTTLEEYLRDNGISSETTVTLQYVRSLVPPVFEASFEHDDWVSSVDVSPSVAGASGRLLSGSYDGLLRLWNAAGQVTTTSTGAAQGGHTAGVKAARFVTATHIASAGLDRTVRIWKYSAADDNEGGEDAVMADDGGVSSSAAPALLKPLLELYGHKGSVDSLAVDAASKRVLSASVDGGVGLWSISKSSAPAAPESLLPGAGSAAAATNKKRKISSASGATSDVPRRGALTLIQAHKNAAATAAIFDPRDRTVAYSAGQDHALCTLDLTTGQVVSTVATSHALLSLCAVGSKSSSGGSGSGRLLAAGNAARNVVLVDPRASVATTAVMTLRGHVNKVVALAAAPDNEYSLVSASHDGTCRVWDLRSSRKAVDDDAAAAPSNGESAGTSNLTSVSEAVYVIDREGREGKRRPLAGEGVKVFDVAWDKTWGIVSGGEDKRVQVNRGRDVVA